VEALLRKYLWAIDLVVIALCAVFLARASASAVEASIVVPPPRPASRAAVQAPAVYSKEFEDILRRNVFCSTCPPIIPVEEVQTGAPVQEAPQKTSLPLALMGIMYSPPPLGLKWSVAVIRDTEDKAMGAYGVGTKVRQATITEIQETRIYLDNGGKTEFLDLLDAANTAATPSAPVAAVSPAPGGDALSQEMDRGIRKTSEHAYEIQRQTLESVLGNMNLLARGARIVPEVKDGKSAGFRLTSIRPGGPFDLIGLQNGDLISSINGMELHSPDKAFEVYAKLKSVSHLSLGLERAGQLVSQEYAIR
jgi:general secretion pathway protein C